jgi:type VI secretion system protein ImpC
MIEMDVATRRKPVAVADEPPSDYLILGDFGGCSTEPIAINRTNFDAALEQMDVRVGTTRFHKLDDFHPDSLCQRVPLLRDAEASAFTSSDEEETGGSPKETAEPPEVHLAKLLATSSLLEQITEGIDPFHKYIRELARAYAAQNPAAEQGEEKGAEATLGDRMRRVLHHPHFQAIESAWRGVDFLLGSGGSGGDGVARLYLAQYSRDDATRDLLGSSTGVEAGVRAAADNHGNSRLRELLGARRWRAVAGLYKFGSQASDIELLRRLALLAVQIRAPFISACSMPGGAADMGPYWSELTAMPEASHLGLALPRFLLRLPYGPNTMPIQSFAFEEMPGGPAHSRYLWGNPALACLSLLARGDGVLDLSLPLHTYDKNGELAATPCAEVQITEVQELALIEAGLMPLVPSAASNGARLAGFRAINGTELPVA